MVRVITPFNGTVPGKTGTMAKSNYCKEDRQRQKAQEMPVLKAKKGSLAGQKALTKAQEFPTVSILAGAGGFSVATPCHHRVVGRCYKGEKRS